MKIYLQDKNKNWSIFEGDIKTLKNDLDERNISIGEGARIGARATIGEGARIEKTYDCVVIGPIGSREGYTTFYRVKDKREILVNCGCWSSNIENFIERVNYEHFGTDHERVYIAACEYAKTVMQKT